MLRFPHVAEKIFSRMYDVKLAESRMVSRNWKMYIDQQRFHKIRIMRAIIEKIHDINNHWRKVFEGASTIIIEELFTIVKNTYGKASMAEMFKKRKFGLSPLEIVAIVGNFDLTKKIMKQVEKNNPGTWAGGTPLHAAATNGRIEICIYLFQELKLENKNVKNEVDQTPFHMAANGGHFNVCSYIIHTFPDDHPGDINGNTPLHHAALKGFVGLCVHIMQNLSNKNPRNKQGLTPLHYAASKGHINLVRCIMDVVDDKTPRCNVGRLPIHFAARHGWFNVCKYILETVVEKNPSDNFGRTAVHLAERGNHLDIVRLIQHSLID